MSSDPPFASAGEAAPAPVPNVEELSAIVVNTAFHLHREIGPGLLESVYEVILATQLQKQGLRVERQIPVPIEFDGLRFDEGFRADLLIEGRLLVELKSVERVAPVHAKQVLTYVRLMRLPVGLLINFGSRLFKEGIERVANSHADFTSSRLRVNQSGPYREGLTRSREGAKRGTDGGRRPDC